MVRLVRFAEMGNLIPLYVENLIPSEAQTSGVGN